MVRILGLILIVSWISYPILVLSGVSHTTTYVAMSFLYITIGVLFLGGMPPLLRYFLFFQEKALNEFPPGLVRSIARIIFGEIGIHRSKLEWICVTIFGGTVFLGLGVALFCLATDRVAYFEYLIDFFR